MGDAYAKLSPIQQQWLHVREVRGRYIFGRGVSTYMKPHFTANLYHFEKTTCKTIALEIKPFNDDYLSNKINFDSMDQLIRVLNFAHDQGGRRIILINQTGFSNKELLAQIKKELPSAEREKTWSRLKLLLCETEETIFNYDQFNQILEPLQKKSLTFSPTKMIRN